MTAGDPETFLQRLTAFQPVLATS